MKLYNGNTFIDVENGKEVNGNRTEEQLYAEGYKKACPYMGNEQGERVWVEYPRCWVEELIPEPMPEETTN